MGARERYINNAEAAEQNNRQTRFTEKHCRKK
jgi:hypothetical protein